MQVLEREAELASLGALLSAVRDDRRGRLVLLSGEAGAGKTALLRYFCGSQPASLRVLWGSADALFTPRPLGPIVEIAEAAGGELEQLLTHDARPYDVAFALMRELAGARQTVLVLEDLQWADEATLDVLRIVARRIASVPSLVVAIYRDDQLEPAHPLRIVLGESAGSDLAIRMELAPLSPRAVAELAAPYDVNADELHRLTGGNPFFVTEVLAGGSERLLPATVRDAVLARAARLSDHARAVLEAVAVVPPHAELWLLETLADPGLERLDECLASGMLRFTSGGVTFRHELARLAIEESLAPTRRLALHRRALAAFEEPPSGVLDLERLADHADAAADVEALLRFAPAAAARAAAVGAHREAAAQYARALRFGERLDTRERAQMLERHAHACFLTDQHHAATAALDGALACYRELGDLRAEGNALRAHSSILWCPGTALALAHEEGHRAVALLEGLEPGLELGMAYGNLAALSKDGDDLDGAIRWGECALELAERLGNAELLVYALGSVGAAEAVAGAPGGEAKLARALELAQEHRLVEQVGRVGVMVAACLVRNRSCGAPAGADPASALAYCSEHGLELYRHYLLACDAQLKLDRGAWADAVTQAEGVLRFPRASTVPTIVATVVAALAHARQERADRSPALERVRALADRSGELQRMGPVAAAQAEVAWLEGRAEQVEPLTQAAFELASQRGTPWTLGELACWRHRAGVREMPPPDIGQPFALELSGDNERAAKLWSELQCPYNAALALAAADDEAALRRSLHELHRLGARPAAAIVARRLRSRGARGVPRGPRSTTRANPANLSAREVEVLGLVAEGLRNAEIAQRLFLSPKTVDHHISAILGKLQVRTRGEAGAAASRLGLLAQDR
jgi:DNA-binding CsgD family transcriptional regulator